MEIGKLPESILKRSIFKQLHTKRDEVLQGAGVGEDCAAMQLAEDEVFVISTDPITGTATDIGKLSVHVTLNDLATTGAEPIGIMMTLLFPESITEPDIKAMIRQMEAECAKYNVQIMGGHTEVTKVVNQPLVSITGIGKAKKDALLSTGSAEAGDDIVATKWIGLEGTSIISKEKEMLLREKLPQSLIDTAKAFDDYISVVPEARIAADFGAHAMHDVTEGGIFGALWEMAEASGIGLDIDIRKIPLRQETVEVCEYFNINPYLLISSGCMLMAVPDGVLTVRELEKAGIPAVIIGKAVAGNDRVLVNGEERRFLEPPKTDEIYKVI